MKKLIRLTEADLHRIVKESVNKVLNEIGDTPKGQFMLGRAAMRNFYYPYNGEDKESGNEEKRKDIMRYAQRKAPYSPNSDRFFDGMQHYHMVDPKGDYINGKKSELDPNDIKHEKESAAKYLKDIDDGKINTNYDEEEYRAMERARRRERLNQPFNRFEF